MTKQAKNNQQDTANIADGSVLCGVLFPRQRDIPDVTGCLKQIGHDGEHLCKDENGTTYAWLYDYSCNCGCNEDDFGYPCASYEIVD